MSQVVNEENIDLIVAKMIDNQYMITNDSPEYIRNNYDLLELSLSLNRNDVIEYASEEVLLKYPRLIDKALANGYRITPNTPDYIKISFLNKRIYQEGNKIDAYIVSCLNDITQLNNQYLYKFINCANKNQITPEVLGLFLESSLEIASIGKGLWKIIINDQKLIDVILIFIDACSFGDVRRLNYLLDAFFPRSILNSVTEANLDYVLDYISVKYHKDFGNRALLKYKLQYLKNKNEDVFDTLLIELLTDKYSFLGIETINCMMTDSWVRHKILMLQNNNFHELKVLEIIMSIYADTSVDMNNLIYLLLNNGLGNDGYDKLFENIDYLYQVDYCKQRKIVNNLISVLINLPFNDYNIEYFWELEDEQLLIKRKKFFDSKCASNELYFLKKYNLSMANVRILMRRYRNNQYKLSHLELLPDNLRNILSDIDSVYGKTDNHKIEELYKHTAIGPIDVNVSVFLEELIRNEYIKVYDSNLYQPVEKDRLHTFDSLGISVYEVPNEFGMLVHAVHPYYDDIYNDDIHQDWNRPYIKNHGICCCYLTNQNTSMPDSGKVLMGFCHLENNSILLMAPYDMHSINNSYASTYEIPGCFCFPDDLINNTRDMHCEVVIERKNLDKETTYKRQPDYLVYKTEVDGELNPEKIKDSKWNYTVEVAKKFNIPIVIINETKIIRYEYQLIQSMLRQIIDNQCYELIPDMIVRFMNNVYSFKHIKSGQNVIFSSRGFDDLINQLVLLVESLIDSQDYVSSIKILDLLIVAFNMEIDKISLGRGFVIGVYTFKEYIYIIKQLYAKIPENITESLKKKVY